MLCCTISGVGIHSPMACTSPKKGRHHWGNLQFIFTYLGQTSIFLRLNWDSQGTPQLWKTQHSLNSYSVKTDSKSLAGSRGKLWRQPAFPSLHHPYRCDKWSGDSITQRWFHSLQEGGHLWLRPKMLWRRGNSEWITEQQPALGCWVFVLLHTSVFLLQMQFCFKKKILTPASLPDFNRLRWQIAQERVFLNYSAHTLHNFTSRVANFPKINTPVTSNPIKRHFPSAAMCTERYLVSVIGILGRRNCCSSKPSSGLLSLELLMIYIWPLSTKLCAKKLE